MSKEQRLLKLSEAVGKTITGITCTDNTLCIAFTDNSFITLSDHGQSCCEARYMVCDDDPAPYVGATFLGAVVKVGGSMDEDNYDVHDYQFLEVQTSIGPFTVANHNEHNGYYGGFDVCVDSGDGGYRYCNDARIPTEGEQQ